MARPTVTTGADSATESKTPTQRLVEDANRIVHVTDARGRVIGVRRLSLSVSRRVVKALGAKYDDNQRYLRLATIAACVVTIDGRNVDVFENGATEIVFDTLVDQIDNAGLAAVAEALEQFEPTAGSKEDLKNS